MAAEASLAFETRQAEAVQAASAALVAEHTAAQQERAEEFAAKILAVEEQHADEAAAAQADHNAAVETLEAAEAELKHSIHAMRVAHTAALAEEESAMDAATASHASSLREVVEEGDARLAAQKDDYEQAVAALRASMADQEMSAFSELKSEEARSHQRVPELRHVHEEQGPNTPNSCEQRLRCTTRRWPRCPLPTKPRSTYCPPRRQIERGHSRSNAQNMLAQSLLSKRSGARPPPTRRST